MPGPDHTVKRPLRFRAVLGVALLSLACFTAGWGEDGRERKTVPGRRLGTPEPVAASCAGTDLSGLQTAIYVSPQGNDSATCGASPSTACQTIQQGINNCGATGCGVLVRHGLYQTGATIQLRDAVSVYGSCVFEGEADHKYRTVVQAAPAPGTPAISGSAINTATTVSGLVVLGQDETANGTASIAMTVSNSTGLTLSHTVLASGKGGDSVAAMPPGQAGQGTGGGPGSTDLDSEDSSGGPACAGSTTSGAGGGGAGWRENGLSGCFLWCVCNASGGSSGGTGGQSGNVAGGSAGGPGSDAFGCTGLSGTAGTGGPGFPGSPGACSTQGGTVNTNIWGSFDNTSWMPSSGGVGGSGNVGSGGGGGGAGGLCATGASEDFCNDSSHNPSAPWVPQWGFPGGGGGGGGCGGVGGPGGPQGGASIALVLFNSSVTLVPDQNSMIPGPGGRGGGGGQGGIGGPGGAGGPGGSNSSPCGLYTITKCIGWAGFGGPGGDGGQGGAGSGGAGGNGGPSIGIALAAGSPVPVTQSGIYAGLPGAGGAKGVGGQNASSSTDPMPCQGANGQDGVAGGTAALGPNTMVVNEELTPGQSRTSSDGRYLFILQTDGNLCLYGPAGFLWCSNTAGQNTQIAIMQADGNFCLYNQGGNVFCTYTVPYPDAYLTVQDDGDVVIYSGTTRLWATNTAQQ